MICTDCGHPLRNHGQEGLRTIHNGVSSNMCWHQITNSIGLTDACACTTPLPEGLAWVDINDRWHLILPKHRAARTEWPWWEAARLSAMYHFLNPPGYRPPEEAPVVFDVGSEEGDFPALWASWGCDVLLIEPNPKVWPNIKLVFEANDLEDRVRGCFVGFASDEHGQVNEHHSGPDWPDCADGPVIGDHGFLQYGERPEVQQVSIDDLSALHVPPTCITIDVEGAELIVLRGASNTLAEHRPLVFVSEHDEFMRVHYRTRMSDLHEFMAEVGYERVFLASDHETHAAYIPRERMWAR